MCDVQCAFAGVTLIESHQQEHIQRNTDALRNMCSVFALKCWYLSLKSSGSIAEIFAAGVLATHSVRCCALDADPQALHPEEET